MRLPVLVLLATIVSPTFVEAQPFHWPWSSSSTNAGQTAGDQQEKKVSRFFRLPWSSRATEQQRINAATAPKPTSREEEILRADETKAFNLSSAKFGTGVSVTGKKTATSEFQFVDKTRTKSFATKELFSKPAWGAGSKYETKAAPTKESWFARLTANTGAFATRDSSDAKKGLRGAVLPGSEKKFLPRGRRQAELDADRAEKRAPKMTLGGDRDGGESWSGDMKPLTIKDVKALLNKN